MRSVVAAVTLSVMTCGAGLADDNVVASDPASVVKALQDYGLAAKLGATDKGRPKIDLKIEGLFTTVYFYDCDDKFQNCQTLNFEAIFSEKKDYPVELANDWNYDNRFASSYRNKDATITLSMDVNLARGGVSAANFADSLDWWDDALVRFKKHIDY